MYTCIVYCYSRRVAATRLRLAHFAVFSFPVFFSFSFLAPGSTFVSDGLLALLRRRPLSINLYWRGMIKGCVLGCIHGALDGGRGYSGFLSWFSFCFPVAWHSYGHCIALYGVASTPAKYLVGSACCWQGLCSFALCCSPWADRGAHSRRIDGWLLFLSQWLHPLLLLSPAYLGS